ncbi:YceI family protein [Actinomadura madurae]|uniref:YceI family protein n=1 Tax=Actinomadura madurae TaxID=1993 RepID=UPI002025C922|nr:YceI family protein [Actinomadura madurae]MCP9949565.1 YceI family protein [Actinomadura madurae]MCP9966321.1 YceI family protein [Actinomadura madurae]MCP9978809.1 YceI family protein [Actinomadura madurae]MCQ0009664.1 YceI family protein [Actinomadura madurae]MCQ0014997.1 YceI family protein [Actinomadura madurae]
MTAELVEIPGYVAGTWTIDPVHSGVGFTIRHLMVSKVRGRFGTFEGTIVTGDDVLDSSVTATIELTSIDTGNSMRDEHVRSADYLDVVKYPTMTYRSTGLRADGEDFVLDGELTLRGVTKNVPLKLEIGGFGPDPFREDDPFKGARAGFTATGEISRLEFGVGDTAKIPGSNGLGLSEKVQIVLEIQAVLKTD